MLNQGPFPRLHEANAYTYLNHRLIDNAPLQRNQRGFYGCWRLPARSSSARDEPEIHAPSTRPEKGVK